MNLLKNEIVVTAFAERASGPGWGNRPIWVIVENIANGKMRRDCIQPGQHTAQMAWLFDLSEAAHKGMTEAVVASTKNRRKRA